MLLLTKVIDTIRKYDMLKHGDRVLVAVSGGPDSVCLLSVLRALAKDLNLSLHVAHLDHMFRGKESADEALFVSGLAKKFNLSATVEKVDVPSFCREHGLSAQAGAREIRYDFFNRVASEVGATRIATGHTATDQAETFLMRLLRGAGVGGLSAIPPKRENIIRPLIGTTRDEVLMYLESNGVEFVTDPSNARPVYTRNKIRLELLPVLRLFNPRIDETLAAEAALLRDEDEAVEACLTTVSDGVITQEEGAVALRREQFNALPRAFKRRLFKKAADRSGVEASGLSSIQIDEALVFMAAAQTGRTMRLSGGLAIEREYERLIVRPHTASAGFSYTCVIPGVTAIPEQGLAVETSIKDSAEEVSVAENYLWQALFDYDKIKAPLTLRSRRSGDRFCPAGMGGRSKKLQDYLVDEKVPRRRRDSVPLLVMGAEILWAVGLRTDERFLAGPETKRFLMVRVKSTGSSGDEVRPRGWWNDHG